MQMSGNIAQRKKKIAKQNERNLSEYLSPQAGLRKEVRGVAHGSHAESNGTSSNSAGFLLLDTSHRPLYANQEAVAALTYQGDPTKGKSFDSSVESRVQSLFSGSNGSRQLRSHGSFSSGRRSYELRVFSVTSPLDNGFKPALAVLFERKREPNVDLSYLFERYRLTRREVETVDHLVQGLDTNQIADHMDISPNTVKAFLRSIMMKMGADSRAQIIVKLLQVSNSVHRETSS